MTQLLREIHSAQQVLETGILTQGIESRIYFEQNDQWRAEIDGYLQRAERFVFFSQAGVDESSTIGVPRNILKLA